MLPLITAAELQTMLLLVAAIGAAVLALLGVVRGLRTTRGEDEA